MNEHRLTRSTVTQAPASKLEERAAPRGDTVSENGSVAADRSWRNPSYGVRVALVGVTWMVPGVLAGLLAALFVPVQADPAIAGLLGAVLCGVVGAGMEALDSPGSC